LIYRKQTVMDRSPKFRRQLPALLVAALALPACSAQLQNASSAGRAEGAPKQQFAGDWGYATDCNFGHHVTLSLKEQAGAVTGEWSDGTNVRGSQGSLKGAVRDGKLSVAWCSEAEERGGYPLCPTYSEPDGYLVRRGETLVWMRGDSEYVVLTRGENSRRAQEECED